MDELLLLLVVPMFQISDAGCESFSSVHMLYFPSMQKYVLV